MADFTFILTVSADSANLAQRVITERIYTDEDYGFDYTIDAASVGEVLVTGNPVSGFGFIGPFPANECAVEWADRNNLEPDWWVAKLTPKESA